MMTNYTETFKGSILIVDDIPENLQLLFEILTEENYEVRRVLTGKQAITIAKIDPPDLILLDIKMPEMDGYEICSILKQDVKTENIPIIFLSALNETFDKVKAFQVGGVDYISKPFHLPEVLARVENQLQLIKTKKKLEEKNFLLSSMNQELESQKQELEIVNRELEAFNYRVSHDIRNELSIIQGFSQFLLDNNLNDKERVKFALENIASASKLIEQIIKDLIRLSRINKNQLNLDIIDLSSIVLNLIPNLERQNKHKNIEWKIGNNIQGYGDANLLFIALQNLLSNAYKYSSNQEHSIVEFAQIIDENNPNNITYYIKDNGVGFDMNEIKNIFAPFHRLHNDLEFEGTGIGLATVQKIIHLHGGKIWCEGKVNEGAIFYFQLPQNDL